MLSVLNIRLATRLPHIAKAATCHVARPVLASHPSTRSFWSSTRVEEPTKSPAKKAQVKKEGVKPEQKKRAAKQSSKAGAGEKKPKRVIIPKEARPPKGSCSAYVLFFKGYMDEHEVRGPGTLMASAVKAGEEWRGFSEAEKAPYVERAKVDREKYVEELGEWFKHADPAVIRELNKRGKRKLRVPKLPGEPSRPPTSFLMYLQDRKAQSGDITGVDSMRKLAADTGKEWLSMTAEQKRPYQERFDLMLKEYHAKKATQTSSE